MTEFNADNVDKTSTTEKVLTTVLGTGAVIAGINIAANPDLQIPRIPPNTHVQRLNQDAPLRPPLTMHSREAERRRKESGELPTSIAPSFEK